MPSNNKRLLLLLVLTTIIASFHVITTTSAFATQSITTHHHLSQRILSLKSPSTMPESTLRQRSRSKQSQQQPTTTTAVTSAENQKKKSSQLNASVFGIDEWSSIAQIGVFFSIYTALGTATYVTTNLLDTISKDVIGLEQWRNKFVDTSLPILLGSFYCFAGIGHFTSADAFRDIYPPIGTWGFWYIPGSSAFHVTWTGVVEVVGGIALLGSGLNNLSLPFGKKDDLDLPLRLIQPVSALILFVLTILVTPSNIYMFTHGAVMGDMPPLGLSFHAIRFGFQVLFLSLLYTLSKDSFFYAWGDELD